jgi:hypothetical protein
VLGSHQLEAALVIGMLEKVIYRIILIFFGLLEQMLVEVLLGHFITKDGFITQ